MNKITTALEKIFKNPFFIIVLFSLIARILVHLLFGDIIIFNDSHGYIEFAGLLSDLNLSGYNGQRSPGYPVLICLAGNNIYITAVVQTVIGIFTSLYYYKIMNVLGFRRRTALIVTILLNTLLVVLFYEVSILTETLTLFFIAFIFYTLLNGFFTARQSTVQLLWFSFVLGYLTLIKTFYIFLPFVIYGLYTLKHFSFKNIVNRTIVIIAFPLIAFLGWSYVNRINTGYFVSTTFYGINISQNCVSFAEKAPPEYKLISDIYVKHREMDKKNNKDIAMSIWSAHAELTRKTGLNFADLSAELAAFSKATIAQNPVDYIKQVGVSWYAFWRTSLGPEYIKFKNAGNKRIVAAIHLPEKLALRSIKISFVIFMPLHLANFIRNRKVSPQFIITIIVLCTSLLQAMATYGTNSRFSFPFEFIMVISVLLTVKQLLERYSRSHQSII